MTRLFGTPEQPFFLHLKFSIKTVLLSHKALIVHSMKGKPIQHKKKQGTTPAGTVFRVTETTELMAFLIAKMPERSRNKIKILLSSKRILVDKQPISQFNYQLVTGMKVEVLKEKFTEVKKTVGYEIVFEDKDVIVINKQAGILSVATEKDSHTAYSMLREYVKNPDPKNKIFIVHRLDRDTSGLMIFAKNEPVKRKLQDTWEKTVTDRAYVALVEGRMEKKSDKIVSWLTEDKNFKVHSLPIEGKGKEAITRYSTLKSNKKYSLLKVNLETGRKNQIRVHMQEIGHPVAGDKKYGAVSNPIKRLGLHAQQLAFIHPVTGENLNFETEIPESFMRMF